MRFASARRLLAASAGITISPVLVILLVVLSSVMVTIPILCWSRGKAQALLSWCRGHGNEEADRAGGGDAYQLGPAEGTFDVSRAFAVIRERERAAEDRVPRAPKVAFRGEAA